jgi:hypothetical protein
MRVLKTLSAMPIDAPSPLVGEGIIASQHNDGWVRGSIHDRAMPRQPLTRLRFAKPPSPTRGEGRIAAIKRVQLR